MCALTCCKDGGFQPASLRPDPSVHFFFLHFELHAKGIFNACVSKVCGSRGFRERTVCIYLSTPFISALSAETEVGSSESKSWRSVMVFKKKKKWVLLEWWGAEKFKAKYTGFIGDPISSFVIMCFSVYLP